MQGSGRDPTRLVRLARRVPPITDGIRLLGAWLMHTWSPSQPLLRTMGTTWERRQQTMNQAMHGARTVMTYNASSSRIIASYNGPSIKWYIGLRHQLYGYVSPCHLGVSLKRSPLLWLMKSLHRQSYVTLHLFAMPMFSIWLSTP